MSAEVEIAKLTKAQREALIKAELDGNLGRYFSRFISAPAGRGLVKAGLGTAVWSGIMLSQTGLAVRAFLASKEQADADR
jgi:hypothetical protein